MHAALAAANGFLYGWVHEQTENGNYVKGLADFAAEFVRMNLTAEQRDR